LEEQVQICEYRLQRMTEYEALTAEAQRGIEVLQERCTALISAAVTGKIDVRKFASGVAVNAEHFNSG